MIARMKAGPSLPGMKLLGCLLWTSSYMVKINAAYAVNVTKVRLIL